MRLIHISCGGPDRWISCAGKVWRFEDHPHCGPIVLTPKTGEVADPQPAPGNAFWRDVSAWYQQGKKTESVGGKVWCVFAYTRSPAMPNRKATTGLQRP